MARTTTAWGNVFPANALWLIPATRAIAVAGVTTDTPVRPETPVDLGADHCSTGGAAGEQSSAVEGGNAVVIDVPGRSQSSDRVAAGIGRASAQLQIRPFRQHDQAVAVGSPTSTFATFWRTTIVECVTSLPTTTLTIVFPGPRAMTDPSGLTVAMLESPVVHTGRAPTRMLPFLSVTVAA